MNSAVDVGCVQLSDADKGAVINYGEGRGSLQNCRGEEASEVLPLTKRVAGKSFLAMLKRGHNKLCDSFNMGAEVLAILVGGGGGQKIATI